MGDIRRECLLIAKKNKEPSDRAVQKNKAYLKKGSTIRAEMKEKLKFHIQWAILQKGGCCLSYKILDYLL